MGMLRDFSQITMTSDNIVVIPMSDLEFGKRLGEGGFATVYKGEYASQAMRLLILTRFYLGIWKNPRTGERKDVAIKQLHQKAAEPEDILCTHRFFSLVL